MELVVYILLRVLGLVQGFRLTQHCFHLKMVIRSKHVALIIEENIQNSVALDGNPEPNSMELSTNREAPSC
jgi:hypothetical protein